MLTNMMMLTHMLRVVTGKHVTEQGNLSYLTIKSVWIKYMLAG